VQADHQLFKTVSLIALRIIPKLHLVNDKLQSDLPKIVYQQLELYPDPPNFLVRQKVLINIRLAMTTEIPKSLNQFEVRQICKPMDLVVRCTVLLSKGWRRRKIIKSLQDVQWIRLAQAIGILIQRLAVTLMVEEVLKVLIIVKGLSIQIISEGQDRMDRS
jgi:hypothetical protein